MSVSEKLKQFHENYLSAKAMVESAEGSASKTIKYLPTFRRIYSAARLNQYKNTTQSQQSKLRSLFCQTKCQRDRECLDACTNYYNEALAEGREFIRKVQKEYKLVSLDDEDE